LVSDTLQVCKKVISLTYLSFFLSFSSSQPDIIFILLFLWFQTFGGLVVHLIVDSCNLSVIAFSIKKREFNQNLLFLCHSFCAIIFISKESLCSCLQPCVYVLESKFWEIFYVVFCLLWHYFKNQKQSFSPISFALWKLIMKFLSGLSLILYMSMLHSIKSHHGSWRRLIAMDMQFLP